MDLSGCVIVVQRPIRLLHHDFVRLDFDEKLLVIEVGKDAVEFHGDELDDCCSANRWVVQDRTDVEESDTG